MKGSAKTWALISFHHNLGCLHYWALAIFQIRMNNLHTDVEWMPILGSRFSVELDGMGKIAYAC